MPVIDYIDGPNRRIYLHADTVGVDLHPMDIYKEMRTIRSADESLRKYDCFLAGKGKEAKGGGKFTERYVVCLLGTRIVPFDTSQILTIIGTIITDDGQSGTACFDKSLLNVATRVDIHYEPPQVEVIELGGTTEEVVAAIWEDTTDYPEGAKGHVLDDAAHLEHIVFVDTELAPVIGKGTELNPFGATSDAITFAEEHGFRTLGLLSELIIDRLIKNFTVRGIGGVPFVDTNGQNIDKSSFYQVKLHGLYLGTITVRDCMIGNGETALNGNFDNCAVVGDLDIPDGGSALLNKCTSLKTDLIKPRISIGGIAGTANASIMGHSGGLTITNMTQPTDSVKIMNTGIIEIDSSCIDGIVVVIGLVRPIDNSGPGCNVQWLNVDPAKLANIPADVWNHTQ